jgi:hypothetical protein
MSFLTFERRTYAFPDGEAPAAVKLPQCQLHVEERQSAEHQHDAVRDQKGSCNRNESEPLIRVFSLFYRWHLSLSKAQILYRRLIG